MNSMTLKQHLLHLVTQHKILTRKDLRSRGEDLRTERNMNGFDIATVDRALRKLTQDGDIIPVSNGRYITHYKLKGHSVQSKLI